MVPAMENRWDDPVADTTEWEPTKSKSGASFRTHHMKQVGENRREFQLTKGAQAVGWALVAAGIVGLLIAVIIWTKAPDNLWWAAVIAGTAGVLFILGRVWYMRTVGAPITFDSGTGVFRGRGAVEVPMDTIHALQLLGHEVIMAGGRDRYWCSELNLVHPDGTRTHVVAHGGFDEVREEAKELAGFLGVALWDGTREDD